jgi:hypothetical protein
MRVPRFAAGAAVAVVGGLALAGCGSSSPSSSSAGGGGSSQTAAPTIAVAAGGSFCQQTVAMEAQVSHLAAGIGITTPGATPSIKSYQPLYATIAAAIDALDSQAPSEIASAFHTFRSAFDQANSRLQSATSLAQLGDVFAGLSAPQVKAAGDSITAYMKGSCGISPTP